MTRLKENAPILKTSRLPAPQPGRACEASGYRVAAGGEECDLADEVDVGGPK